MINHCGVILPAMVLQDNDGSSLSSFVPIEEKLLAANECCNPLPPCSEDEEHDCCDAFHNFSELSDEIIGLKQMTEEEVAPATIGRFLFSIFLILFGLINLVAGFVAVPE